MMYVGTVVTNHSDTDSAVSMLCFCLLLSYQVSGECDLIE